jgi:hypothetical protein
MAFKVFNNRDEASDLGKAQLLVAALRLLPPTLRHPDNNAYLQGLLQVQPDRTLGKTLPFTSLVPSGPCPQCGQNGHWKNDCPSLSLQSRLVSHSHSQQSEDLVGFLGLMAED